MSPIKALAKIVRPPESPVAARGDWSDIEAALGPLPRDFKQLVEMYGTGSFCDFLHPLAPFFSDCPMVARVEGILEAERSMQDAFPDEYPFPYHPEKGGLLPWAVTDNGDRLFWHTEGRPGAWKVVVWHPRGPGHEVHDVGAVAFLAGWLGGGIHCQIMGPAVEDDRVPPFFDPYRELRHVELRLSEAKRPFDACLELVRSILAPTESRGGVDEEGTRQEHFLGTTSRWKVTYETMYGHRLRIAFPPEDSDAARAKVKEITKALDVRLLNRWKAT